MALGQAARGKEKGWKDSTWLVGHSRIKIMDKN